MKTSANKMNILMITRAYGKRGGGMERLSWELTSELQKSEKVNVDLIAHRGQRATSPLFLIKGLFLGLWKGRKSDVIYLGDPLLSAVGWVLKMIWGKPVAVTIHGLDVTYGNSFYQWYLKTFGLKFDLYLPISRYSESLLNKFNVKGKVMVINPGVQDSFFDDSIARQALTKVLGVSVRNKKVLVTVGRLTKRKGHEWFIREVLPNLQKNVMYVVAGAGKEGIRIKEAIRDSGMSHRVIMLGRVRASALKVIYNTADVFVQPNVKVEGDAEGFGLVLLEASLCNMPVVAARLEGMVDAINDGRNGVLVEAKNAVAWRQAVGEVLAVSKTGETVRQYTLDNYGWGKQVMEYIRSLSEL